MILNIFGSILVSLAAIVLFMWIARAFNIILNTCRRLNIFGLYQYGYQRK